MKCTLISFMLLSVLVGTVYAGTHKFVHDDQKCPARTIKAVQNGVVKAFYADGKLKEEWTFKDGKRNGPAKMYYRNGQVYWEVNYINDRIDGMERTYYESGKKEQENTYKNGKYEGLATAYYESGKKERENTYKNGKYEGLETTFYESGKIETEETYKNGKIEGLATTYFEDGTIKRDAVYRNGQRSPDYPHIIIHMSALVICLAGVILLMKLGANRNTYLFYIIMSFNLPAVFSCIYEYKVDREPFDYVQVGLFIAMLTFFAIVIIKPDKKGKTLKKSK